ncbi:SEC-C motif-containing protein [Agromyces sp. 3263]|uniref:YchJ family protein n=1 Tax=Agromyces sp. 3263 TaxID=2817750 RepID=UPI002858F8F2|nr:YchJ family metal-binding protein [Agromyces sp. 3263]MDR6907000.1 SEC-C motif-containing protein [Agromyces sp. 3263]
MPTPSSAFPQPSASDRCPCLSGSPFGECCDRFLTGGAHAPTAEQLMRSRYTGYAVGARDYLLETWHPSTRPTELALDPAVRWYRLDIERRERGGPLDRDGVVEFRAYWRNHADRTNRGVQHETSRFLRERGRWRYVDAID